MITIKRNNTKKFKTKITNSDTNQIIELDDIYFKLYSESDLNTPIVNVQLDNTNRAQDGTYYYYHTFSTLGTYYYEFVGDIGGWTISENEKVIVIFNEE